jgi:hypothetical protein
MIHLSPRIKSLALGSLCIAFCASASAHEGPKPKIIISPPPGQAVWTVKFSYTKTRESLVSENKEALEKDLIKASDMERIDKITYTIKKPVSCRVTDYDAGGKSEAYNYEDREFAKNRGEKGVDSQKISNLSDPQQHFVKKFPGVHWVKPKLFVKIENAYGESCALFKEEAASLTAEQLAKDDVSAEVHSGREAWFSMKTGLPVAFKEGDAIGKFTFGDPASASVTIPQDVRESISTYAKYQEFVKKRNGQ